MENKIFITACIVVLGILCIGVYIGTNLKDNDITKWLPTIAISLLLIGLIVGLYILHKGIPSEKQIADNIKQAIEEQHIADSVTKAIEKRTLFTINSNQKFLQDMAASISNSNSPWTKEQIDRFLQCMETIGKREGQVTNEEITEKSNQ